MHDSNLLCGTLELHDEFCAFARFGTDSDLAVVRLNDLVYDRETKASAAAESALKRLKNFVHLLRVDSRAAVVEADPPVVTGRAYSDIERS